MSILQIIENPEKQFMADLAGQTCLFIPKIWRQTCQENFGRRKKQGDKAVKNILFNLTR